MHLPKLLTLIWVAAIAGATVVEAQSDDTPAQARMREALHQKLNELNGPGAVTPPPAPAPAPAPEPAPVVVPPPAAPVMAAPAAQPAVMLPHDNLTPTQEENLRNLTRQSIAAQNAAIGADYIAPGFTPTNVPPALDSAAAAKTFEAERTAKALRDAQAPVAMPVSHNGIVQALPPYNPPVETMSAAAMVPGSKEQRLYELLQKYKADQITPTEYHDQRAKIVGQP